MLTGTWVENATERMMIMMMMHDDIPKING